MIYTEARYVLLLIANLYSARCDVYYFVVVEGNDGWIITSEKRFWAQVDLYSWLP